MVMITARSSSSVLISFTKARSILSRWGDRGATIESVLITQEGNENPETLVPGRNIEFKLVVRFHSNIERPIYGLAVKSSHGALVLNVNSRQLLGPHGTPSQYSGDSVIATFSLVPFLDPGDYLISFGIASESDSGTTPHDRRYDSIMLKLSFPRTTTGDIAMDPQFSLASLK